jgi:hypothetical protein
MHLVRLIVAIRGQHGISEHAELFISTPYACDARWFFLTLLDFSTPAPPQQKDLPHLNFA